MAATPNVSRHPDSGGAWAPEHDQHVTGFMQMKHVVFDPQTFTVAGALPPVAGIYFLNAGSGLAMTLLPPAANQDGDQIIITSLTAQAHTVSTTGGKFMADGATGSPHSTATYAAKGSTLTLIAANQLWNVQATAGVTIA